MKHLISAVENFSYQKMSLKIQTHICLLPTRAEECQEDLSFVHGKPVTDG